jgi:CHASE2 domain-containing sensor protein
MTELTSRRDLAKTISDISTLSPKALGVDIVFEGLKEDSIGDQMLAEAAKASHGVFSYKIIDRTDEAVHSFFTPCDSLTEGFTNMPRQLYDGTKRNISTGRKHQGELRPSLIKLLADQYAGEEVMPLADKEIRINFSPMHFKVISYADVLSNRNLIEDRVVLLGAMKEENDMHITPLGKMAGPELLAFGVETLLKHNKVRVVPIWLIIIISFLVTLMVAIIRFSYINFAKKQNPILRSFLTLELVISLVVFTTVAFTVWIGFILFCKYNISVNLAYGIAATACIYNATNLYDTIMELVTKKKTS